MKTRVIKEATCHFQELFGGESIPYHVNAALTGTEKEAFRVYPTFSYVGYQGKKFAASRVSFLHVELFTRYSRMGPEDQERFLCPLFSLISREEATLAYVTIPWEERRTRVMKVEGDQGGLILSMA